MASKTANPNISTVQSLEIGHALRQAKSLWSKGDGAKAEQICRNILRVHPAQPDASHLLGIIAHAHGHLDAAINHLRDACRATKAPAIWLSNLAEMCRQSGLLEDGEAFARRAIKLDKTLPGAWNNLGIILQEQGKFEESRRCLETVLRQQPDNAQAQNNMGNTLKRLGLLKQAEAHWARALQLEPNYAEVYSNMAVLLTEQAEFDRAAKAAISAIRLKPRLPDPYINLAGVESARLRHAEGLRHLDALLAFAPDNVAALAARAAALKHLDLLDEALQSAQRAVALDPRKAEAQNALGTVLQAMGRFDEALAAFDAAAALPSAVREKALVNRAVLFMEHGRSVEAGEAFQYALSAFPHSASAWFNRADLAKFTPGDPATAAMEALLARDDLSQTDRMLMHFAIGKAHLDLNNSDEAFRHLNAGNAMKRKTISYDADATTGWLDSIEKVFTPALLKRLGGKGVQSQLPVFVLGMPRSGTTLVEQILASHPEVHGAGELRYVQYIVDELGAFPQAVAGLDSQRLSSMGDAYLKRVTPLAGGKRHVVDKMPANFLFAGLIRLILPEARIIHCRRDPVDTSLSCYSKLFAAEQSFTYDLAELGKFHRAYQKLTAHWRKVLPAGHFTEVDYEAVVEDTEAEARRLISFIGLDWDPSCLAFYDNKRAVRTASVNQVRQPVYKTSSGRWRKHAANLEPLLHELGVKES